jgi:hypothetical protein
VALLAIRLDVREEVRPKSDFGSVFQSVAILSLAMNEENKCFVDESSEKILTFSMRHAQLRNPACAQTLKYDCLPQDGTR